MGNSNSTPHNSGTSSSSSNQQQHHHLHNRDNKAQIIDLNGNLHIDLRNRNLKKLKSIYFYNFEILQPDSIDNSDFMKNKNSNRHVKIKEKNQEQQQQQAPQSPPTSQQPQQQQIQITPPIIINSEDGQIIEKMEETPPSNNTFYSSSPVPSPSSSPSKKIGLIHQFNPDWTIQQLEENMQTTTVTVDIQTEEEGNKSSDSFSITPPKDSITSDPIANDEKTPPSSSSSVTLLSPLYFQQSKSHQSQEYQSISKGTSKEIKRSNSDLNNQPKSSNEPALSSSTSSSSSYSSLSSTSTTRSSPHKKSMKKSFLHTMSRRHSPSPIDIQSLGAKFNVYSVDLSLNRLETIQEDILSILNQLSVKEISLSTNFFSTIPDLNLVKTLSFINLSRNKLNRFPIEILSELPNLSVLILDRNNINEIPGDIDRLKNLNSLSIKNNGIENLPNSICNLCNLISLDLSYNKLKTLPSNFEDLINLKSLWLTNNSIHTLPTMKKLINLAVLEVSSNRLTSLSKDFALLAPKAKEPNGCDSSEYELVDGGGLGSLREINIRDNRDLVTLPPEFKLVESTLTIYTSLPTEIIPGLFLGGLDSANNSLILQSHGITHVVLAIGDLSPFFPKLFKYYTIDDARDTPQYDLSVHFDQTSCFIEQGRKAGGVLVHCRADLKFNRIPVSRNNY
eukprot:gene3330-4175_t